MVKQFSRWATIGLCVCMLGVIFGGLLGALAWDVSASVPNSVPNDVLFTKTAAVSGTNITYTLTISNADSNGDGDPRLVTVDDQMPYGVEIGESCTVYDPNLLNDPIVHDPMLLEDENFSRAEDRLIASAALVPDQAVGIACPAEANVGIEVDKSAVQPIISSGEAVSFMVTLTNSGAITLTKIILEDTSAACDLPPELLLPAQTAQLTCITTNVQETFTNVLTAEASAIIVNSAIMTVVQDGMTQTALAETTIVVSDTVVGMDSVVVVPSAGELVVHKTAVQNGTTLTYTMSVTNTAANTVSLYVEDQMNGIQADYCLAPDGDFIRDGDPLSRFTRTGMDVLAPNETIQFVCVATVDPQIDIEKNPMMQTVTAGDEATFAIVLTGTSDVTSVIALQNVTVTDSFSADCVIEANDGVGFVVSGVCAVPITTTITTTITAAADISFSNQFTATIVDPQTLEPFTETTVTDSVTHTFTISDVDVATVLVDSVPLPAVALTKTVSLIRDGISDGTLQWTVTIENNRNIPTMVRVRDQLDGLTADQCLDPNGDPLSDAPILTFIEDVTLLPNEVIQFICVSTLDPTLEITLTPDEQMVDVGQTAAFELSHLADGLPFSSVTVTTPDLDCVIGACSVADVTADFTQSAAIVATLSITNEVRATLIENGEILPDTTVSAVATYTAVFSDEATATVTVIDPLPILDVEKTAVQDGTTLTWTVTITNSGRVPATLDIDDRMSGIQADYCLDPNGDPLLDQDGNERGALTFFVRKGEDVLRPDESLQFVCVATVDPTLTIEKNPPIQTVMVGDTATFNVAITATVSPTSQLLFENVTISDPITPDCEQVVITPTMSGFDTAYSCDEPLVTADITNIITATADIYFSNEVEVSAIDPETGTILSSTTVTDVITAHIVVSDTAVALIDARSTAEEGVSLSKQSIRDGDTVTYTIRIANSNLADSPPLTVTDQFPPAYFIQTCEYIVMDDGVMGSEAQRITDQIDNHILTHVVQVPAGTEAEIVCVGTLTADLTLINTPRTEEVREGNDALFDVTIFNTGDIDLTDLTITANMTCTAPATDGLPANSETAIICTHLETAAPITSTVMASATAVYINVANVQSGIEEPFFTIADVDELTTTLTMSDTASVTILSEPGLVLSKTALYQPRPDGSDILTYTISVTNSGTLSATYIITDAFPFLSSETGERFNARCDGINGGELTDILTHTVSLEPNMGVTFVCVGELDPAVVVTKTAASPVVESGNMGEFMTDIYNAGNVDLTISVQDDLDECSFPDYDGLYPSKVEACNNIATVHVTDTVVSTAIITGRTTIENVATASIVGVPDSDVTARASFSLVVTGTSTATIEPYIGQQLNIEKSTNGIDGDDPSNLPDALIIDVGDPITWSYTIQNRGNFTFTDLILSDNDPNIGRIDDSNCTDTLTVLLARQTITCTLTSTAVEGQYVNVALVVGTLSGSEIALSDTDRSAYLGVTPTTTLGTVGDVVFHDINNDGRQNGTEPGLVGVSVILTLPDGSTRIANTDEDGRYQFRNLPEGAYRLDIDIASLPDDKVGAINSADPDQPDDELDPGDNTSFFTISRTMTTTVQNFGYHLLNTVGEISGTVFHDVIGLEGRGLAGVRVNLLLPDGTDRPSVTDENGRYQFTELPINATYEIVVITETLPISKQNATNSDDPDLTDDNRTIVALTGDTSVVNNLNFGYLLSSIVGGIIVNDFDGIPSSGDEQGIPNVLIRLINNENNDVVAEQTTTQSGSYSFRDRPVGEYTVVIVTDTLPATKNSTFSTYPDPNPIELTADNLVTNQNLFGFRPIFGAMNGIVYHDINRSNTFDSSWEPLQPNVTVLLTDGTGEIRTAVTNAQGEYQFDEVMLGEHAISLLDETLPDEKQCLSEQGEIAIVALDQLTQTVQFGTITCPNGIIGNRVWSDDDGDHMFDPSNDTPLSGIHISLTLLLGDGTPSTIVLTATTDTDGLYLFNGLPLGVYELVVDATSLPEDREGWVITVDPDVALNGRSIVNLLQEPSNLEQDFAFGQIPTAVHLVAQKVGWDWEAIVVLAWAIVNGTLLMVNGKPSRRTSFTIRN